MKKLENLAIRFSAVFIGWVLVSYVFAVFGVVENWNFFQILINIGEIIGR